MNYHSPRSISEALAILAGPGREIVCGGTDVYATPRHMNSPELVDVSRIEALQGISCLDGRIRIGAATTWEKVAADADRLPASLVQAAKVVGSRQIQHRGTIGGNICHAASAADGLPPLLTWDAEVELISAKGERLVGLAQFLLGRRKTLLAKDEILAAVWIRQPRHDQVSGYFKIGNRATMTIAVLSAAVRLEMTEDKKIANAAIAIGSASEIARRLHTLEPAFKGLSLDDAAKLSIGGNCLAELSPIDDLRATAEYRREMVALAIRRAMAQVK